MVMTTSEASTASGVRILGLLAVMSMPISFIASTATGLIWSAGADPAERTSTCPSDRAVMKPAAIWDRPALWTQTNMTLGRWDKIGRASCRERGQGSRVEVYVRAEVQRS